SNARRARDAGALEMAKRSPRVLAARSCDDCDGVRLDALEQQLLHARGNPLELARSIRRRLNCGRRRTLLREDVDGTERIELRRPGRHVEHDMDVALTRE